MEYSEVQAWIDKYVSVWRSPGTAKLTDLFTDDITYSVSPWKQPINGLEELKPFWKQARSSHKEVFDLESEIVAIEGQTAVARITVEYADDTPARWRDLWIIKFDDTGRCRSFEEWPFYPEQDDGQSTSGS